MISYTDAHKKVLTKCLIAQIVSLFFYFETKWSCQLIYNFHHYFIQPNLNIKKDSGFNIEKVDQSNRIVQKVPD